MYCLHRLHVVVVVVVIVVVVIVVVVVPHIFVPRMCVDQFLYQNRVHIEASFLSPELFGV